MNDVGLPLCCDLNFTVLSSVAGLAVGDTDHSPSVLHCLTSEMNERFVIRKFGSGSPVLALCKLFLQVRTLKNVLKSSHMNKNCSLICIHVSV